MSQDKHSISLPSKTPLRPWVPDIAALLAFVALVSILVIHHEPWADEAQAWQLARNVSFTSLFTHGLHDEHAPGLWHVLLRLETAVHISYAGMHWVTAAFETITVALLLRFSPFPAWLRLSLPFTFFLAYQYAVVARPYTLFALLLFAVAALWAQRLEAPWRCLLLLGLLAQTSLHGVAVAAAFAMILALEMRRTRSNFSGFAWVAFLAALVFAAWCGAPIHHSGGVQPSHLAHPLQTQKIYADVTSPNSFESRHVVLRAFHAYFNVIAGGLARPRWLMAFFWILLALFLRSRNSLRYLIPPFILGVVIVTTKPAPYHLGLVWLTVIATLWMTWPESSTGVHRFLTLAFTYCIVMQLLWTAEIVPREIREPYSPTLAALPIIEAYRAQGIKLDLDPAVPPGFTVSASFFSVAVQPYFTDQPFQNLSSRFWIWDGDPVGAQRFEADTAKRSVAVMEVETPDQSIWRADRLLALGYRKQETVCGVMVYPSFPRHPFASTRVCYSFFTPPKIPN